MAHVLIGFAEALPAPEVVFSLIKAGHQVSAFARSRDLPLARLPLQALHVLPAPEEDAAGAITALQGLMAAPDAADYLLPLDDVGLWLANAALPADARIAGATGDQADVALNKARQMEAAQAAGLAVPDTVVLADTEAFATITQFPAILKPALAIAQAGNQLTKGGAAYLLGPEDIARAQAALAEEPGPFLLQPLIHGVGEGVFGFVTDEGVLAWSGHQRVRMMNPHGSGSSACQALMPEAELCAQITAFLKAIGWQGAFMVELLRDAAGTPWFMELNGRQWGSMALARRQGLEYPAWNVAACEVADFVPTVPALPSDTAKPLVLRNLGREILHLLFVLRGPKSAFHREDWPTFLHSLRGVFKPARRDKFYNYDPAYPGYFLRDALWSIRKTLKR